MTSDDPNMYHVTRPRGWTDLNETALVTWNEEAQGSTSAKVELGRTVLAWFSLARCSKAIIAPVDSSFSNLAAQSANVGFYGCCSAMRAGITLG